MGEIQMKKVLIATAAIAMLATSSIADAKSKSSMSHYQFMLQTQQMIQKQKAMLNAYEKLLKQMMENESSSHNG
jgi:Ni/Co efflux regulator RcnB